MDERLMPAGQGPNPRALEAALARLVGVEAARVCVSGGTISEVHIAATPGSRAKNVARDVRSFLAAAHGIEVDHKRISIAVERCAPGQAEDGAREPDSPRVLFRGCQQRSDGGRADIEVRLEANGRLLVGHATGVAGQPVERLAAEATLAALAPVLCPQVLMALGDAGIVRFGGAEVALVEVIVQFDWSSEPCVGASRVEGDRTRAAIRAVLGALDQRLGSLIAPQWTEIQVEAEGDRPGEGNAG